MEACCVGLVAPHARVCAVLFGVERAGMHAFRVGKPGAHVDFLDLVGMMAPHSLPFRAWCPL